MAELNLSPGTSAQEAIYCALFLVDEVDRPKFARRVADELIDYLARLEQDAHRSIFDKPKPTLPPQAIGWVPNTYLAGQSVTVITVTGAPLDLGPEQPPPYAGEDLTAGQPVEWASWLAGRAVVGVTT
jgi:hypothetical protein